MLGRTKARVLGVLATGAVSLLGTLVPAHASTPAHPVTSPRSTTTVSGAATESRPAASAVSPGPGDSVKRLQNQATGWCLDHWEGELTISDCINSSSQWWVIHPWRDGTKEVRHSDTGLCLDDSDAYGLRDYPCNASEFQSWYVHTWADGTQRYQNEATRRCLDHSFAYGLRTFACNTTKYQSWW